MVLAETFTALLTRIFPRRKIYLLGPERREREERRRRRRRCFCATRT